MVLAPKQDGSMRQTIHGKYYELPELAASDLAVPLEFDGGIDTASAVSCH